MAPICFHPAHATETTFTQITFLALNPASVNHLLLLCLNSEWEWGVAHIHLLKVFYFLSLFQKVLPRWVFFSLLTRFLYFSTSPLYDPHLKFSTFSFPGAMMPESSHCLLPPDTNDYPPGCVAANGNSAGFKPISSTPRSLCRTPTPPRGGGPHLSSLSLCN